VPSPTSPLSTLTVAPRFCGPPGAGNGGYVAGILAAYVASGEPVTVTLRAPAPLATPLEVRADAGGASLHHGSILVAESHPGELRREPPPRVDLEAARAAEPHYAGLSDDTFQGCFVCGTARDDGLALQPGPVGDGMVACSWTPGPTTTGVEFVWSALDCPGAWTTDMTDRPLVLGRITAQVEHVPAVGSPVVVVAQWHGDEGRKTVTSTAAYDEQGGLVGRSEQVWIAVDPAVYDPVG
jgi:hypothetical protein